MSRISPIQAGRRCACQKKYRRAPGKGSSRKEELCVANVHLRYECQRIAIRITEFGQPELHSRRARDQRRRLQQKWNAEDVSVERCATVEVFNRNQYLSDARVR